MKDKLYKRVYISSEADLPKESNIYFVHLKEQRVSEIIYNLRNEYDKPWWMQYIDWYFLPIKQQSRRKIVDEEIRDYLKNEHYPIARGKKEAFDLIQRFFEQLKYR